MKKNRKRILALIVSASMLSGIVPVMAENDLNGIEEGCEYGYIFTVKAPSVRLFSDGIDEISEADNVYHADTLDDIKKLPPYLVDKVAKDGLCELFDVPNDPYYPTQWQAEAIGYQSFYDNNVTGENIKVGIIDTGILDMPDFANAKIEGGLNMCAVLDEAEDEEIYNLTDNEGHGTGVAGIIASGINDHLGIAGITDRCTIVPIRVYDTSSKNNMKISTVLNAMIYARDISCDVVNMSLGFSNDDEQVIGILNDIINSMTSTGMIICAAVGNKGMETNINEYPASHEDVIGVGALDNTDEGEYVKASLSSANNSVFVSAPGTKLIVPGKEMKYWNMQGTSFACPMVSAAAIGAKFVDKDINTEVFKQIIKETAIDKAAEGYDTDTGWGMISLSGVYEKAVEFSETKSTSTPEPTPSPEPTETPEPTIEPTVEPTAEPTIEPTTEPTIEPTIEPTEEPAETATPEPTGELVPTETPKPSDEPASPTSTPPSETPAPQKRDKVTTVIVDSGNTSQVIVMNNTVSKIEGIGILAVYHADGSLWTIKTIDGLGYKKMVFNIEKGADEYTAKFMLWDSLESMKPVDLSKYELAPETDSTAASSHTSLPVLIKKLRF